MIAQQISIAIVFFSLGFVACNFIWEWWWKTK